MTAANWPYCLQTILHLEGGLVDNPRDPGGVTNKGITLTTLIAWKHGPATVQELIDIDDQTVSEIYQTEFWDTVKGSSLPSGVDLIVFDQSVNSGPAKASKTLQTAVGTMPDGIIGPHTLAAVAASPSETVIEAVSTGRQAYYRSLPTFDTFGRGWLARLQKCTELAIQLASETTV